MVTLTEMQLGGGCVGLLERHHHGGDIGCSDGGLLDCHLCGGGVEALGRLCCSRRWMAGSSDGGISQKTTSMVVAGGVKA